MKQTLATLLLLIAQLSYGNMASPIREGTLSSSAFSSRQVDILKEKIEVTIDKDFQAASYVVEYFIKTDTNGKQIPLLFHAADYKGDFKVWVDEKEVNVTNVPAEYHTTSNSPFKNFSNSFQQDEVVIYWDDNVGSLYNLNDLKYFETALSKGEHKIRVEYVANVWTDVDHWVKEYSFRYSLSPAKYWRSFGSLEIYLDATKFKGKLTTNLNQPQTGKLDSVAVWTFEKLPANYFQIKYVPEISPLATQMIAIGTGGLTIIFAIILILLHLLFIIWFRKRNPKKRNSWALIAGSILIPFFIVYFNMCSYEMLDAIIGEQAGRYHGYSFLVIILYPLLMPLYFFSMWMVEKLFRRRLISAVGE